MKISDWDFFRRKDGTVVLVGPIPFSSDLWKKGSVAWQDEDGGHGISSEEECAGWTLIDGARDFPEAKDPRLPYEFDLFYDFNRLSDIVEEFGSIEAAMADKHIASMCKSYEIDLRDPESIRNYNRKFM